MSKYNVQERFYTQYKKPHPVWGFVVDAIGPIIFVAIGVIFSTAVVVFANREAAETKRLNMLLSEDYAVDPGLLKSGIVANITIAVNGETVSAVENPTMYPKYQRSSDISRSIRTRMSVMPVGTRLIIREDKDIATNIPILTIIKLTDSYLCGIVHANPGSDKYATPLVTGELELISAGNEAGIYSCVSRSLSHWR